MSHESTATAPMLHTSQLLVGYPQKGSAPKPLLGPLNLALHPGTLTVLVGVNGAGKSSLLRTLAGMLPPLGGQVNLAGQALHHLSRQQMARQVCLVLTGRPDVPYLTAGELVALGRYPYTQWTGRLAPTDAQVVAQAMQLTGTKAWQHLPVQQLSDGQMQKVMIARALAQNCPLMLLDEPTAHLDLVNRLEVALVLKHIATAQQKAVLMASHDLDIALQHAHQLWVIDRHGQLHAGTPTQLMESGTLNRAFDTEQFRFQFQHPTVQYTRL